MPFSNPEHRNAGLSGIAKPSSGSLTAMDGTSAANIDTDSTANTTDDAVGMHGADQANAESGLEMTPPGAIPLMSLTPPDTSSSSTTREPPPRQIEELTHITCNEDGGITPPAVGEDGNSFDEPPNGGFRAWTHAVAGFIITLNTQGLNMAFGMFQAYYEKQFLPDSSPAKIAWIGSFQMFATFFMCLATTPLLNKGYFRLCLIGGTTLLLAGLVSLSFCTKWWHIMLVQGVMMGIGMGLAFSSGVVILTSYFSTRLGTATAIAATGSSIGGIIFPLILKNLLADLGFGWTIRVIAFINVATMVPVNIVVRQRAIRRDAPSPGVDWTAFTDVPYMLMLSGFFFAFWGFYFGFYFISSYGQDVLGMTPENSLNLLIAMNSANLLGRFIPSVLSDACIGPINTVIPSAFLSSAVIFLWLGSSTPLALFMIACFYGFVAAGVQGLYPSSVLSFTSSNRAKISSRLGFVFAVIGIGSLTGAPLGGLLISLGDGEYFYAELFAGSTIALGGLLFVAARLAKAGWEPRKI